MYHKSWRSALPSAEYPPRWTHLRIVLSASLSQKRAISLVTRHECEIVREPFGSSYPFWKALFGGASLEDIRVNVFNGNDWPEVIKLADAYSVAGTLIVTTPRGPSQ